MLVLSIKDLRIVNSALNLHTNIIYINIYYKRGNPTNPNETQRPPTKTNYSQISPTKPKEAQSDPFAMLYHCIVKTTKNAFFQFTGPV